MIIDEKGLCRAMKKAWSGIGYEIAAYAIGGNQYTVIHAPSWMVEMPTNKIPRKALGFLAETIGCIPTQEQAYRVSKENGAQSIIPAVILEAWRKIAKQADEANENHQVKKTLLSFGGYQVWQRPVDLKILVIEGELTGIVDRKLKAVPTSVNGQLLAYDGDVSRVYISAASHVDSAAIDHLEKMQWVQAGE